MEDIFNISQSLIDAANKISADSKIEEANTTKALELRKKQQDLSKKVSKTGTGLYQDKSAAANSRNRPIRKEDLDISLDVIHEKYGAGFTIPGQFTDTTVDVLFDHGIEKLIPFTEIQKI